MAQVLDLSLDFPLLIAAARRTRLGGEMVVPGELQQARVKLNGGPAPIEDGAAQGVIDQRPRTAAEGLEGGDMAAQKTLERWSSVKSAKSARE